jgi:DNA polymerase-3 subunit beta
VKITLERDDFLAQLQAAVRVASTRSAIQALSGVQIAALNNSCELRATDADMSLRVPLRSEILRDGTVVLPARLLMDVVRALPQPSVSVELRPTEGDVEILCGNASFHLRTLHAEDFPVLPTLDSAAALTLPLTAFVETATKVSGSASRDETRPVLTGILVSAVGREVRMVATDSYRLSVKTTELSDPLQTAFEVNIPARALQELARLSAHSDAEEVTVSVRQNQVVFAIGAMVLSSRLIDGQFPNYRQLLPESFEHELHLDGSELREVVRRVSLLAQKNAPLRLSFTDGELTISAQTPDIGEARESLPAPFHGEAFEIGFNPEFLREGLDAVGDAEVVLKLISPLRPGLLEAGDGSGFVYLIMPIRLNV